MTTPPTSAALEQLEALDVLDRPASAYGRIVRKAIPAGPVKEALSGRWLGHAFHPVAAYVPLGTWMSATILDLVGGDDAQDAADLLIGVGLAGGAPAAISGASDWADGEPADDALRRVGVVHAVSNVTAQALMAWSLVERRRGRRGRGKLLGLAGTSVVGLGGWLGGHLAYALGSGVDQTTFLEPLFEWTPADVSGGQVHEGVLTKARAGDTDLVLTRVGGEVRALADRCCHRGGPLHEGELEDGCVVCPLHASKFSFEDGSCVAGPGPYPQRSFDVREPAGGPVEVRQRR